MHSLIKQSNQPSARHCVIFVHGFTGGSTTFCNDENKWLFEYLPEDVQQACEFYSFAYHTRAFDFKWVRKLLRLVPLIRRKISERSNRELGHYCSLLQTHYTNQKRKYDTVNFICHSMGGVIAKEFIVKIVAAEGEFNGFYITLATPHRGVEEAKALSFLSNRQVDALRPFAGGLAQIGKEWRAVSARIKAKYYRAIDDDVVDVLSSYPEDEEARVVEVDGTHISVSKPTSADCALMLHLGSTIRGFISSPPRASGSDYTDTLEDKVLFLAYRKEYEPYYFVRNVDRSLSTNITYSNVWLSGPSGCGKTVLTQRAMQVSGNPFIYVDLSPCSPTSSVADFCDEIYAQLCLVARHNKLLIASPPPETLPFVNRTSELLKMVQCKRPYYVVLDEVPLSAGAKFEGFANTIMSLLSFHANTSASMDCRFVISTMISPLGRLTEIFESKFPAFFTTVDLSLWTPPDMAGLFDLLVDALHLSLNADERASAISGSAGSPRALKNVLQRYLLFRRAPGYSIASAISEVNKEDRL